MESTSIGHIIFIIFFLFKTHYSVAADWTKKPVNEEPGVNNNNSQTELPYFKTSITNLNKKISDREINVGFIGTSGGGLEVNEEANVTSTDSQIKPLSSETDANEYGLYFSSDVKSYMGARKECEKKKMRLVTIEDKNKNNAIYKCMQKIGKSFAYFIGARRKYLDSEDTVPHAAYMWENGNYLTFRNFMAGSPNNEREVNNVYVAIKIIGSDAVWVDESHLASLRYICEPITDSDFVTPPLPPNPYNFTFSLSRVLYFNNIHNWCGRFKQKDLFIFDKKKHDALKNVMAANDDRSHYYLPLKRKDITSPFIWTNGVTANFTSWAPNEPVNNTKKLCVEFNYRPKAEDIQWTAVKCDIYNFVVCENFFTEVRPDYIQTYITTTSRNTDKSYSSPIILSETSKTTSKAARNKTKPPKTLPSKTTVVISNEIMERSNEGSTKGTVEVITEKTIAGTNTNITINAVVYRFFFSNTTKFYLEARKECQKMKMRLVVIEDKSKNNAIYEYLQKNGDTKSVYFIGARRRYLDSRETDIHAAYIWENGHYLTFKNFAPDNPNNEKRITAYLSVKNIKNDATWLDQTYVRRKYICEPITDSNTVSPPLPPNPYKFTFSSYQLKGYKSHITDCRNGQMNVFIFDKTKQDILTKILAANDDRSHFYLPLNRTDVNSTFIWSNGEEVNFTSWAPKEPGNKTNQLCVEFTYRPKVKKILWFAVGCNKFNFVICEHNGSYPQETTTDNEVKTITATSEFNWGVNASLEIGLNFTGNHIPGSDNSDLSDSNSTNLPSSTAKTITEQTKAPKTSSEVTTKSKIIELSTVGAREEVTGEISGGININVTTNGESYGLFFSNKTEFYVNARKACKKKNMRLVVIEDKKKNNAIYEYLKQTGDTKFAYFIGARRRYLHSEGPDVHAAYMWENGHYLTFRNFGPGLPSNEKYKTVDLSIKNIKNNAVWLDQIAGSQMRYICERITESKVVSPPLPPNPYNFTFTPYKINNWNIHLHCLINNQTSVFIFDKIKQDVLTKILAANDDRSHFYLPLFRKDVNSPFIWANGIKPNFTSWAPKEPGYKVNQLCVEISYRPTVNKIEWFAIECNRFNYIICENYNTTSENTESETGFKTTTSTVFDANINGSIVTGDNTSNSGPMTTTLSETSREASTTYTKNELWNTSTEISVEINGSNGSEGQTAGTGETQTTKTMDTVNIATTAKSIKTTVVINNKPTMKENSQTSIKDTSEKPYKKIKTTSRTSSKDIQLLSSTVAGITQTIEDGYNILINGSLIGNETNNDDVTKDAVGYGLYFSNNVKIYMDAEKECRKKNMRLVTIESRNKNRAIFKYLHKIGQTNVAYFIGAKRRHLNTENTVKNAAFRWENEHLLSFRNFAPNYPNNQKHSDNVYLAVKNNGTDAVWIDKNHTAKERYICEPVTKTNTIFPVGPPNLYNFTFTSFKLKSYKEHISYCSHLNKTNIYIDSRKKEDILLKILSANDDMSYYYLPLKRKDINSPFIWEDGKILHFTNWDQNEPKSKPNHLCVQFSYLPTLNDTKWKTVDCNIYSFVACENVHVKTSTEIPSEEFTGETKSTASVPDVVKVSEGEGTSAVVTWGFNGGFGFNITYNTSISGLSTQQATSTEASGKVTVPSKYTFNHSGVVSKEGSTNNPIKVNTATTKRISNIKVSENSTSVPSTVVFEDGSNGGVNASITDSTNKKKVLMEGNEGTNSLSKEEATSQSANEDITEAITEVTEVSTSSEETTGNTETSHKKECSTSVITGIYQEIDDTTLFIGESQETTNDEIITTDAESVQSTEDVGIAEEITEDFDGTNANTEPSTSYYWGWIWSGWSLGGLIKNTNSRTGTKPSKSHEKLLNGTKLNSNCTSGGSTWFNLWDMIGFANKASHTECKKISNLPEQHPSGKKPQKNKALPTKPASLNLTTQGGVPDSYFLSWGSFISENFLAIFKGKVKPHRNVTIMGQENFEKDGSISIQRWIWYCVKYIGNILGWNSTDDKEIIINGEYNKSSNNNTGHGSNISNTSVFELRKNGSFTFYITKSLQLGFTGGKRFLSWLGWVWGEWVPSEINIIKTKEVSNGYVIYKRCKNGLIKKRCKKYKWVRA